MVGTGKGAENGVLIRDGERWRPRTSCRRSCSTRRAPSPRASPKSPTSSCSTASRRAGDGDLRVADEDGLLRLAAAAERGSEHPLGEAIVAAAERGLSCPRPSASRPSPGPRHPAVVDGRRSWPATSALHRRRGYRGGDLAGRIEALTRRGKTPVIVSVDGRPAGAIAVADTVKPALPRRRRLRELGLEVVMLTGDNRRTAEVIARPGRHRAGASPTCCPSRRRPRSRAAGRRQEGGHGRRRHQRRPGAGAGRHRHRHRHRHRRGHGGQRHHAHVGRPGRRGHGHRSRGAPSGSSSRTSSGRSPTTSRSSRLPPASSTRRSACSSTRSTPPPRWGCRASPW
jgi:hypothetical protein